jgi:hypothetical protein
MDGMPEAETSSAAGGYRRLAWTLLASGTLVALATVLLAGLAIYDAERLPLIDYVQTHVGNGRPIVDAVIGSRSVRIQATHTFGYVLSLSVYGTVLLAIATVARALIASGVRLLVGGAAAKRTSPAPA